MNPTAPLSPAIEECDDQRPLIVTLILRSPWWLISAVFHVLVITLIGLVTMTIEQEIAPTETVLTLAEEPLLINTDLDADIVIPADILATAKLDAHFEVSTNDPAPTKLSDIAIDQHAFTQEIGVGDQSLEIGTGTSSVNCSGFGTSRSGGGRRSMVKRHGCGCGMASAVDQALEWLIKHQESDGHWDAVKNGADFKTDTAVTALALLSLSGAGHSEKVGLYKNSVKCAVAWLISLQNADGLIFDRTDAREFRGFGYPHALATLALCEATGMGNRPATRAAAQKAIDYCIKTQSASGGWRYEAGGEADLSVTGWYVMALKSAKAAGLKVDRGVFARALRFVDSVEIKGDAKDDYTPPSHYLYQPGCTNHLAPHRIAAVGNLIRQFTGTPSDEQLTSVQWFMQKGGLPAWGVDGESVDLYYWYYGNICAFHQGGDAWKAWNLALKSALLDHQYKNGGHAGSWPVAGQYSREWGRVGQTALACLCLEVYYAYERLP